MTPLLEIRNLQAEIAGRKILNGLDLTVNAGEIHAIMGPNGAGKSTLSYVLAGKPGYEITGGEVRFRGEDLLAMSPDERAAKGVFLAFQYPLEIPGVATVTFLRSALNAQRRKRGEEELSSPELLKRVREIAKRLGIDPEMLRRPLNVGFSGGEKKRNETLQMALLEPLLCVLDETDSGLDIDALKIVANGVNALRSSDRGMIVITHYQRLLDYIVPDIVHVLSAAGSCGPAARTSRSNSRRPATRNTRTRRRDGHERWNPPRQDSSRTRSGRCLHDVAAGPAGRQRHSGGARRRVQSFCPCRTSALPRRGLEVHRSA